MKSLMILTMFSVLICMHLPYNPPPEEVDDGGAGRMVSSQLHEGFFGCRMKCRKAISCEPFNHELKASDLSLYACLNCGLIDQSAVMGWRNTA